MWCGARGPSIRHPCEKKMNLDLMEPRELMLCTRNTGIEKQSIIRKQNPKRRTFYRTTNLVFTNDGMKLTKVGGVGYSSRGRGRTIICDVWSLFESLIGQTNSKKPFLWPLGKSEYRLDVRTSMELLLALLGMITTLWLCEVCLHSLVTHVKYMEVTGHVSSHLFYFISGSFNPLFIKWFVLLSRK